ncbi:hypothetical protein ES288_D04G135900v1 [Gossypium darwinii]|uniref:Uncharacterized protein n=1 Tax=Gossypium darwinii TaxID=34276 RepID=A0A5D2CZZ9_GOSDA|nr:hypothetical protein ES288_D04G135900v1 [Gossypium darwinii]
MLTYLICFSAPLVSTPVRERNFSSSEELITKFYQEYRIVRKGWNGDLKNAMKDGKPIIIEVNEFKSIEKFKIFNTNNLWRSFQTRRRSMESRFFNWKLQLVQQLGYKIVPIMVMMY